MQKKKRRVWPIVLIVILVLAGGGYYYYTKTIAQNMASSMYSVYGVTAGDLTESVTASGTLEPNGSEDVKILSELELAETFVSVGDSVNAGDKIAAIDEDSLSDYYESLKDELDSLDAELRSMDGNTETEYVRSPVAGRVKKLFVGEGGEAAAALDKDGALMLISTNGRMKVNIETGKALNLDDTLDVRLSDGTEEDGKIKETTEDGYVVTFTDNGPVYMEEAEVYLDGELLGKGTIDIDAPLKIIAEDGIVNDIEVEENESVSANGQLLTLNSDVMTRSYKKAFDDREETAGQLDEARAMMKDPSVTTPYGGTVKMIEDPDGSGASQSGADAQQGAGSQSQSSAGASSDDKRVIASIDTGGVTSLTVEIDEMDIALIETGQQADVTIDALTNENFTAGVDSISKIGDAINGVTTFDVALILDKADERLYESMNASATIIVKQLTDVVLIPLELVQEDKDGEFVYVSPSGAADGSDRQRTEIVTGISDGINAEVISGLSVGDHVVYVDNSATDAILRMMESGPFGGAAAPQD